MKTTDFNKEISENYQFLWDEYSTEAEVNEKVACLYMNKLAMSLGFDPNEVNIANESKKPVNHFQTQMYCERDGKEFHLLGTFVYVKNGRVIKRRSKIELLNEDYETLKKL